MAENQDVPQSTKEDNPKLGMSIEDFIPYSRLAWRNCRTERLKFFDRSDRFTEEFIVEQEARITTLANLPDDTVRTAAAKSANVALKAKGQAILVLAKGLGDDIDYAFKAKALVDAELEKAGIPKYLAASRTDWPATQTLITSVNSYLTANLALLIEKKALKAGFDKTFEDAGISFNATYSDVKLKEQDAKDGTDAQNKILKEILKEQDPMLKMGRGIFEFDPVKRKMFMKKYLLDEVRGHKPSGLHGTLTNAVTKKPWANVTVSTVVGDEERTAISNDKGLYDLKAPKGKYDFKFIVDGQVLFTLMGKEIQVGMMSRFSTALQPPPQE